MAGSRNDLAVLGYVSHASRQRTKQPGDGDNTFQELEFVNKSSWIKVHEASFEKINESNDFLNIYSRTAKTLLNELTDRDQFPGTMNMGLWDISELSRY